MKPVEYVYFLSINYLTLLTYYQVYSELPQKISMYNGLTVQDEKTELLDYLHL